MANQLLIKGAADIAKSKGFNDGFMDAADNLQKWGAMAELQVEDRRKKAEAADAKVIDYLDKMPSSQGLPKVPLNAQAPVAKYLKDSRAEYAAHAKATRDLDPTSTEYADHIEGMNSITAKWGRLNDQMLSFNESKISYVEAVNEQAISYGTKPEDREVLSNVYSEDGTVDVNEDGELIFGDVTYDNLPKYVPVDSEGQAPLIEMSQELLDNGIRIQPGASEDLLRKQVADFVKSRGRSGVQSLAADNVVGTPGTGLGFSDDLLYNPERYDELVTAVTESWVSMLKSTAEQGAMMKEKAAADKLKGQKELIRLRQAVKPVVPKNSFDDLILKAENNN
jgi:hypothetical protein